jgi:hypothetical protein
MEDIRMQTGRFYYIKITPRYIYDIYYLDGQYYKDINKHNPMVTWDTSALYRVKNTTYWLDGSPTKVLNETPEFTAFLNSKAYTDLNPIDRNGEFRTQGRFESIVNVDDVKELRIGKGVILDIVYQLKTLEYAVETQDSATMSSKQSWLSAKNEYDAALSNGASNVELE